MSTRSGIGQRLVAGSARLGVAAGAAALALVLSGCSGSSTATQTASAQAGTTASSASTPEATLVDSGVGQNGQFAWVTSLVRNDTDEVGQTVTVLFNVLDSSGKILVSATQVESFSTPRQDLAVGTQVTVPGGGKVARVEATLAVKPNGIGPKEPKASIPPVPATVARDSYGGVTANFEIVNPTSEPLTTVRTGVICYNAAKKIVGGGSEYPPLVPPSGKVAAATRVVSSGMPATCTAYPSISQF